MTKYLKNGKTAFTLKTETVFQIKYLDIKLFDLHQF